VWAIVISMRCTSIGNPGKIIYKPIFLQDLRTRLQSFFEEVMEEPVVFRGAYVMKLESEDQNASMF